VNNFFSFNSTASYFLWFQTDELNSNFSVIIDALFGFSFKPPVRSEFQPILLRLCETTTPVASIGYSIGLERWDWTRWKTRRRTTVCYFGVKHIGCILKRFFCSRPSMLISLTAPKLCSSKFSGENHYLGGRFVPKALEAKYDLNLPGYEGLNLFLRLSWMGQPLECYILIT